MINFKELIEAGAHFGHKTSRWSPKMKPYIWGARNKVHLIDVSKTAFLLNHACTVLKKVAESGKHILWVGTKKAAQPSTRKAGEQLSMPVVYHRWIGGTLTNFDQVKKAVTRLLHLRDTVAKPLPSLKKKEIVRLQKEVERLEKNVGGIIDLNYPPAVLVVVDAKKERTAIKEAIDCGIPVIGIIDTNTDPEGIDIVIPANDDSPRAVSFILDKLMESAAEGAAIYAKNKPAPVKPAQKPQAKPVEQKPVEVKATEVKHTVEHKPAAQAAKPAPKVEAKPVIKETPVKAEAKPTAKVEHHAEQKVEHKAVEDKPVHKKAVVHEEPVKAAAKKAEKTPAKKAVVKDDAKKPAAKKAPVKKK